MTQRDPRDELARQLFAAARQERPAADVRRRVQFDAERIVARVAERDMGAIALDLAAPRVRRASALRHAPVLSAAIALAAAAGWLVLHARVPERRDVFALTPERASDAPHTTSTDARSIAPVSAAPEPASAPAVRALARPAQAHGATSQPLRARAASLADEIAQLDRARAALAAANGRRALELVDEYERVMRGTRMRDEAELLRLEALVLTGQRAAAAERARRFVAKNPSSPLADRARALGQAGTGVEVKGGR